MLKVNDWNQIVRELPSILEEIEWCEEGLDTLTDEFIKDWFDSYFSWHSGREWREVILAVREEVTEKWNAKKAHEKREENKKLKVITKSSTKRRLLIR